MALYPREGGMGLVPLDSYCRGPLVLGQLVGSLPCFARSHQQRCDNAIVEQLDVVFFFEILEDARG